MRVAERGSQGCGGSVAGGQVGEVIGLRYSEQINRGYIYIINAYQENKRIYPLI